MSPLLRPILAPLLLILLISVSDCIQAGGSLISGDDESESATAEATPTPFATPWPTPTPRVSPTPSPEPTPTPEPDVSENELEALLLGSSDVPATWTDVTVSGAPTEVPGAEDIDGVLVSSIFQGSDLGPFLAHMLLKTEDEPDAETALIAIEEELADAAILDDITDEVRSWETRPVEFAELGDETFAFKAIGDTGLIPVEADMVGTRVGSYVSFIIHAELMIVDSAQTESFARTATDRIIEARNEAEAEGVKYRRDKLSQLRWR